VFTDAQLVLRVRNGEEWAFEELTARYVRMIEARAALYGSRGEEHEDFRQAALFALYEAACSFRPGGAPFSAYAKHVVTNALIDFLKGACRGKHLVLDDSSRFEGEVEIIVSRERDPCEQVIARETLAEQVRALAGCSTLQRTVAARRLNGLSLIEAGTGLGRTTNAAKTADNALQHVRAKLKAAA
jgi:RNA polymerase sporulation-specific sigma factor